VSPHVTHYDGSLVFRLPDSIVAFDIRSRSILVEDVGGDPSEADTVSGLPFATAHCVRVCPPAARPRLVLELVDGSLIELGRGETQEHALRLAWTVGDVLRCSIEVQAQSGRFQGARGQSENFFDAPTQRISYPPLTDDLVPRIDVDDGELFEEFQTGSTVDGLPAELTDVFQDTAPELDERPKPGARSMPSRRLYGRSKTNKPSGARRRRNSSFRRAVAAYRGV
jgi:hypothetical protein